MSGLINYQITFNHSQSSQATKDSLQDTRRVDDYCSSWFTRIIIKNPSFVSDTNISMDPTFDHLVRFATLTSNTTQQSKSQDYVSVKSRENHIKKEHRMMKNGLTLGYSNHSHG